MKPLCFALMPFGKKKHNGDSEIDFDTIYDQLIRPAILEAGMEPVRADEEIADGIIHKPMFERLILCEYVVADLTTANANVFYELGIRHAAKPFTTILVFANSDRLPFDVSMLRAIPYALDQDGKPVELARSMSQLTRKLKEAKEDKKNDSPLFQLIDGYPNPSHARTDVFRNLVEYSKQIKGQLRAARELEGSAEKLKAIRKIEDACKPLTDCEAGVVVDIFLSYRSIGEREGFQAMVELNSKMAPVLQQTILVQEQLAFALNRLGKSSAAEEILLGIIEKRGESGETQGLLGRVYKDQWQAALRKSETLEANAFLRQAIDAYLTGFETDLRDTYPGVNAVTLLFAASDERWKELHPIVTFSAVRKALRKHADYWDFATLVELAVIIGDSVNAKKHLGVALTKVREKWEPETTANNIRIIKEAKLQLDENIELEVEIEKQLREKIEK